MEDSNFKKLISQLKSDEGCVRNPDGKHVVYSCPAGKSTIGYGHNLDANPVPGIGNAITEEMADRLLQADTRSVMDSLNTALPWARKLDPPRYAVLVNMAFNMGLQGLLGFKNTLAYVRVGDFANAAGNMLKSKWASQVGKRAKRLAAQMRTGLWQ